MFKHFVKILLCLLISCEMTAASALDELYKKVPEQTFVIAATEGTAALGGDFKQTILGQIVQDPQVRSFIDQVMGAVKQAANQGGEDHSKAYLALAEELLQSPTLAGVCLHPDDPTKDPFVFLLSKPKDAGELERMLEAAMQPALDAQMLVKQQQGGQTLYTRSDALPGSAFYAVRMNGMFAAVLNDAEQSLLRRLPRAMNYDMVRTMGQMPSNGGAVVMYADFTKLIDMLNRDAGTEEDAKMVIQVLQSLGLYQLQSYAASMGFDGSEVVSYGKLAMSGYEGLWTAFGPVDRSLFATADAGAVQAMAFHVDPAVLYDCIVKTVSQAAAATEGPDVRAQIAGFEEQIGFKLRDDFLASLQGSFLTYSVPAYSTPELPMGGYALTGRLKNPQAFTTCMQQIGQLIAAMAAGQMQVTSQKSDAGQDVHIWAVGPMAMAQIIPGWAVQGDTVVIASHPSLTGDIIDRLAAGAGKGLMERAEFATLIQSVPNDAFLIGVADSQAQTRQFMILLQQFWPMLRMGLAEQGMQLPIMLPSIDSYIAQMQPSLQYAVKADDGIESRYRGSGLEASPGSVAAGAMGAAILMPALSKTKKIAQRTVSGTNLKGLGTAAIVYANDHDGKFPDELKVLVSEYDVSPKTLESPRKPDGFEGPDYILVPGLNDSVPAMTVLVYENPVFCDELVNVLYTDGHVAAEDKETLRQHLQQTYQTLNRPMPELDW